MCEPCYEHLNRCVWQGAGALVAAMSLLGTSSPWGPTGPSLCLYRFLWGLSWVWDVSWHCPGSGISVGPGMWFLWTLVWIPGLGSSFWDRHTHLGTTSVSCRISPWPQEETEVSGVRLGSREAGPENVMRH